MYNAVTLGDEDVEWITRHSDVKDVIWDDVDFTRYVDGTGVADALYEVSWLHRQVANQLISRGEKDPKASSWAGRTIFLCSRLKRRRGQLRAMYRAVYGESGLAVWVARFEARFPRAVWGSRSEANNKERKTHV